MYFKASLTTCPFAVLISAIDPLLPFLYIRLHIILMVYRCLSNPSLVPRFTLPLKIRTVAILSAAAIFTFLSTSFLPSFHSSVFFRPYLCALTFHLRPLTLFPSAFFISPVSSIFHLSFLSVYVLSLFDVLGFSLSNTKSK